MAEVASVTMSPNEQMVFSLDCSANVGAGQAVGTYTVKLFLGARDVTLTNTTGQASLSGKVITAPKVKGLTLSKKYILRFVYGIGNNIFDDHLVLVCR